MENDFENISETSLAPIDEYDFKVDIGSTLVNLRHETLSNSPGGTLSLLNSPQLAETSDSTDCASASPNVVPTKSREVYEKKYNRYIEWRDQRYITASGTTQEILMAYLREEAEQAKPSSLWSRYSMLKCMLNIHENVDITKFPQVIPYLKKLSVGFNPKKSKIFTKRHIDRFVLEAPDKDYLVMKVILIFGVSGGLTCDELVQLSLSDIKDVETTLLVNLCDPKSKKHKNFPVSGTYYMNLYRKYISLLPENRTNNRLFWNYSNGKCRRKVIGIHQMGKIPSLIAKYLNLSASNEYTGHCFRKTSGMVLLNNCNFLPPRISAELNNSNKTNEPEEVVITTPSGIIMKNCNNCFVNLYVRSNDM